MKRAVGAFVAVAVAAVSLAGSAAGPALAQDGGGMPERMKQMSRMWAPELREKVMALSPETLRTIAQLQASHTRKSDLTFRQVMHEILGDVETVVAGIAVDNGAMAADAARSIANHRIPRGGLFPYLPVDKLNDADLAVLPVMNEAVEGSARQIAAAAEAGDMAAATRHLGEMLEGCVACHRHFRVTPGVSPYLRDTPR